MVLLVGGSILRSLLLLPLVLALLISAARAQVRGDALDDEVVHAVLLIALGKIDRAICGAAPCAPATEQEKANPPLSDNEARTIMLEGVVAAFAERCGINWRDRNYLPLMKHWRNIKKKNDRQMALIGILHGVSMGMVKEKSDCSPERREHYEKVIDFSPERTKPQPAKPRPLMRIAN